MEAQEMAVDQGVETPVDAPEASPAEGTPGGDEQQATGGNDRSKTENRFQKILNENRQYRERIRQAEDFQKSHEAGINFHKVMSQQNPEALQVIIEMNDLMLKQGKSPAQIRQAIKNFLETPQVDPYAEYEKPIQELANDTRSIKEKLADLEKWKENQANEVVSSHQEMIDTEFDRRLVQDGFIDKDGKYNELEVFFVSNAVRTLLDKYAKNPQKPSIEEMDKAYGLVKDTLRKQGGKALKGVGKAPAVPPSGSKAGKTVSLVPGAKQKAASIDEMVAMLGD